MGIKESALPQKSSLTTSDYIRVVGSDNVSYKQLVSDVTSKIIATYATNALGGKTQSIKSFADHWGTSIPYTGNIDSLYESSIYTYDNTVATGTFPTTNQYGTIVTLGGTSNNYATQIAKVNATDDAMYVRYRQNGTWTSWGKVPTRAEMDIVNNDIQRYSSNVTTGNSCTFNLNNTASNAYHYGLLIAGGTNAPYLAFVFTPTGTDATASITPILSGVITVTGAINSSAGTITFTVTSGNAYGGLRYIDLS